MARPCPLDCSRYGRCAASTVRIERNDAQVLVRLILPPQDGSLACERLIKAGAPHPDAMTGERPT